MSDKKNEQEFETDYLDLSPESQKLADLWSAIETSIRQLDGMIATLESLHPMLADLEGTPYLHEALIPMRILKEFVKTRSEEIDWTVLK